MEAVMVKVVVGEAIVYYKWYIVRKQSLMFFSFLFFFFSVCT